MVEINRGPTITQFGVEPDFIEVRGQKRRVRVSKITSLADDLALALAAKRIRMEAPVPGKGYIGVEVPNEEISLVALRDAIQSPNFTKLKNPLRFALGRDVSGKAVAADLADMPHLLVAGTTGSGKSVCVNALISCFLLHNTPDDLRMIMVDPKRVELSGYDGIPHLLAPVVVDLERVVGVLQWVSREMDQRYHKFSETGARHIIDFNQRTIQGRRQKTALPGGDHRRAGGPDDAGTHRNRKSHHPAGPAGAGHRHPPDHLHPASLHECGHRPYQSQLPGPDRLCHRLRR